jgi:uncharacterized membrane protein
MKKRLFPALLLATSLMMPPVASAEHGFVLPPGAYPFDFVPINISGDGMVVLGQHFDGGPFNVFASVQDYAFSGEHEHLEDIISDLAGIDIEEIDYVDAHGISFGGDVSLFISGQISLDTDVFAFVFGGEAEQEPTLRLLANYDERSTLAVAHDVSDDGRSAVGEDFVENDRRDLGMGLYRALWWNDTTDEEFTPVLLNPLTGDDGAWANAMDGAGTRAVGASYFDDDGEEISQAVYWNLSGDSPQAVSLGSLTSFGESEAEDISRNGLYIVGWADTDDGTAPFISYSGGPMSRILSPNAAFSRFGEALGVSNDGRAVGHFHLDIAERGYAEPGTIAFIHSPAWGSKTINQWLQDSGVEVNEDLHYLEANAISEDGQIVVGTALYLGKPVESAVASDADTVAPRYEAIFADGFIAREGSGSINPTSYHNNLGGAGGALQQAFNSINMAMHGSHHIPLQMMKGPSRHAWFTADSGRWDRYRTNSYLAEAGFAVDLFDNQLLAGFGVGENYVEQSLAFDGDMNIEGQYYLAELSYKPTKLPMIFTLTGALGSWDADVDRNYLNAGNIDTSSGSPHLNSASLRFSVHWLDAVKVAGWGFTPKLEYTVNQMTIGGYAEQGGGFPAFFNEQSHTIQELRYGFSAARGFASDKGLLRLRAEGVHRFDKSGPGTSGNVIGLFGFNLPGQGIQQDWVQFGGDVVYSLTQRTNLTFGVSTATTGEDPVIGGSVGVQVKF